MRLRSPRLLVAVVMAIVHLCLATCPGTVDLRTGDRIVEDCIGPDSSITLTHHTPGFGLTIRNANFRFLKIDPGIDTTDLSIVIQNSTINACSFFGHPSNLNPQYRSFRNTSVLIDNCDFRLRYDDVTRDCMIKVFPAVEVTDVSIAIRGLRVLGDSGETPELLVQYHGAAAHPAERLSISVEDTIIRPTEKVRQSSDFRLVYLVGSADDNWAMLHTVSILVRNVTVVMNHNRDTPIVLFYMMNATGLETIIDNSRFDLESEEGNTPIVRSYGCYHEGWLLLVSNIYANIKHTHKFVDDRSPGKDAGKTSGFFAVQGSSYMNRMDVTIRDSIFEADPARSWELLMLDSKRFSDVVFDDCIVLVTNVTMEVQPAPGDGSDSTLVYRNHGSARNLSVIVEESTLKKVSQFGIVAAVAFWGVDLFEPRVVVRNVTVLSRYEPAAGGDPIVQLTRGGTHTVLFFDKGASSGGSFRMEGVRREAEGEGNGGVFSKYMHPTVCCTVSMNATQLTGVQIVARDVDLRCKGLFSGGLVVNGSTISRSVVDVAKSRVYVSAVLQATLFTISRSRIEHSVITTDGVNGFIQSNFSAAALTLMGLADNYNTTVAMSGVIASIDSDYDLNIATLLIFNPTLDIKGILGSEPFAAGLVFCFVSLLQTEFSNFSLAQSTITVTAQRTFAAVGALQGAAMLSLHVILSDVAVDVRCQTVQLFAPAMTYIDALSSADGWNLEFQRTNATIATDTRCNALLSVETTDAKLTLKADGVALNAICPKGITLAELQPLGTGDIGIEVTGSSLQLNASTGSVHLIDTTDGYSNVNVAMRDVDVDATSRDDASLVRFAGSSSSSNFSLVQVRATMTVSDVSSRASGFMTEGQATLSDVDVELVLANLTLLSEGLPSVLCGLQDEWSATFAVRSSEVRFLDGINGVVATMNLPVAALARAPSLELELADTTLYETDAYIVADPQSSGTALSSLRLNSTCMVIDGKVHRSLLTPELVKGVVRTSAGFFEMDPVSYYSQLKRCDPRSSTNSRSTSRSPSLTTSLSPTLSASLSATPSKTESASLSQSPSVTSTGSGSFTETRACTVQLSTSPFSVDTRQLRDRGEVNVNVTIIQPPPKVRNVIRAFGPIVEVSFEGLSEGIAEVTTAAATTLIVTIRLNPPLNGLPIWQKRTLVFEFSKDSFDCPVADGKSVPVEVVAQPPYEPPALAVARTMQPIVAIVAIPSSFTGSTTSALQQARLNSAIRTALCIYSHSEVLDPLMNPLGLSIGPSIGAHYRGALAGDAVILLFMIIGGSILTLINFDPRVIARSIWGAMGVVHMPGLLIVPLSFLMQGAATVAVALFVHGPTWMDGVTATAALLGMMAAVGMCLYLTTRGLLVHVIVRQQEIEEEKDVLKDSAFSRLIHRLFLSDSKWVNNDGSNEKTGFKAHWQELFANYRKRFPWYYALEIGVSALLGGIEGVRHEDYCRYVACVSSVVLTALAVGATYYRPFLILYETGFHVVLSWIAAWSSIFATGGLLLDSEVLTTVSGWLGLLGLAINALKTLFDLLALIVWAYTRYLVLTARRKLCGGEGNVGTETDDNTILGAGDALVSKVEWVKSKVLPAEEPAAGEEMLLPANFLERSVLHENDTHCGGVAVHVKDQTMKMTGAPNGLSSTSLGDKRKKLRGMVDERPVEMSKTESEPSSSSQESPTHPPTIAPQPVQSYASYLLPVTLDFNLSSQSRDSEALNLGEKRSLELDLGGGCDPPLKHGVAKNGRYIEDDDCDDADGMQWSSEYEQMMVLTQLIRTICRRQRNRKALPLNYNV